VLAETLALALVLAAPGSPLARSAVDAPPNNLARARRGLLPRKVVRARPPGRSRRVVLLPQAPSWLGEPGETIEPVLESAVEPAVAVQVEPVSARGEDPGEVPDLVSASLAGAEVEVVLLRRRPDPPEPVIRAVLEAPEVEVVLVRH
jgi:hypothetical protein